MNNNQMTLCTRFLLVMVFIFRRMGARSLQKMCNSHHFRMTKHLPFESISLYSTNKAFQTMTTASLIFESPIITSEGNDKIKRLKLLQTKKQRDKFDLVLLEGHRQILDGIASGLIPEIVILSQKALDAPLGEELTKSLHTIRPMIKSCDLASESIMSTISDTVTNQGAIAAFKKPLSKELKDILSFDNNIAKAIEHGEGSEGHERGESRSHAPLLLALDGISDPGNLGTLIRSAFGLGVHAVLAIDGCDIWSPKVIRSSMGTCLVQRDMPIVQTSWDAINTDHGGMHLEQLAHFQVVLAAARPSSVDYDTIDFSLPTVLIVGSEATGVSDSALALRGLGGNARGIVIPMSRRLESFNAAMAGTSILAEAARQRRKSL